VPVEKINWDKHDVVECDERGRATLGSEYANERVFVYVAELPNVDELASPAQAPDDDTARVLGKMLSWARENDIDTLTHMLDPENGIVTDKHGERHRSPYSVNDQSEYDE